MEEQSQNRGIGRSEHDNWVIIMDLDGTIIDSDIENMEILKELLMENGLENKMDPIFQGLAMGKEFNEIMVEIDMQPETRKSLEKQLIMKMENRKTKLFPDVCNVLKNLSQMGLNLSIVTNNYYTFTMKTLENHGLIGLFDEQLILCYDNFDHLKPSSNIIQEIFRRKKLDDIGKGIIIGNSLKDIEFAEKSRLFIIYLQNNEDKKREDLINKMSYDKLYKVSNWIEIQNAIDQVLEVSIKK